jgi:endoglucanase
MRKQKVCPYLMWTVMLLCCTGFLQAQGYLHRDNKKIVDGSGKEVILKGLNFGNFMIMEGYMMNSADVAGTQHEFKTKLKALIGDANTTTFYNTWLDNHVTKADIDSIKNWGFNSVRVPIHYEYFTNGITKGYQVLDSIVSWCRKDQIYAIIDLHAAPGGQGTDASISDYDSTKPSLWESQTNQDLTVSLWKSIAQRYATEPYVGGYDLINEPNWTMSNNAALRNLYGRLTDSIRNYDKNHILFIEGNWYANDFTGLTPAWDNNMVYSFHKYWSNNDKAAIQFALTIRDNQNYPIWCGETGENSNYHFTKEMELFNEYGIGSAWWPMKKFESINCFASATNVQGYKDILSYWSSGNNKPDAATAFQSMMQLAENLKIQNCQIKYDVLYALVQQPGNLNTKPYKKVSLPGTIYAVDFDYGTVNGSYWNKVVEDLHVSSGTYTAWNPGWIYRNDGVEIENSATLASVNTNYIPGNTSGQWMSYTVNVAQEGYYNVSVKAQAPAGGGLCHIEVNGRDASGTIPVNYNGTLYMNWTDITAENIFLKAGTDTLKFVFDKPTIWLNSLSFTGPNAVTNLPGKLLSASTNNTGDIIYLNFNKKLTTPLPLSVSDFTLSRGTSVTIASVEQSAADTSQIMLHVSDQLFSTDNLTLSYQGKSIIFTANDTVKSIEAAIVLNNVTPMFMIPCTIEAEDYNVNSGMGSETCSDTGGGLDMGYTDANDYMEYLVYVAQSGTYKINFRISSPDDGATAKLSTMDNGTEQVLCNVSVPNTGDWQNWRTVSQNISLKKGKHTLRYTVVKPRFNTNYFQFVLVATPLQNVTDDKNVITMYPNPTSNYVTIRNTSPDPVTNVEVYDLSGKLLQRYQQQNISTLDLSTLPSSMYFIKVVTGSKTTMQKIIRR